MDSLFTVSSTASSGENNVCIYRKNTDETLNLLNSFDGGERPSYHIYNKNSTILYIVNEKNLATHDSSGTIRSYKVDSSHGVVTFLNEVDSTGDDPCFLILDEKREILLCANYSGSSIAAFAIERDGRLSPCIQHISWRGKGENAQRQEKSHPHSICFSPQNDYIYVPDLGCDVIRVLKWENGDLPLKPCPELDVKTMEGCGPRMMSFVGETDSAWVINELSSTANFYKQEKGRLILINSINLHRPSKIQIENTSSHIFCQPEYVLFSNRGLDNLIKYDGHNCTITEGTGKCPRFFYADPERSHLYVAWQDSDRIDLFSLSDKGDVKFEKILLRVPSPSCITQFIPTLVPKEPLFSK